MPNPASEILKVNPKWVKPGEVFLLRRDNCDDRRVVAIECQPADPCCEGCVGHKTSDCRVLPFCNETHR